MGSRFNPPPNWPLPPQGFTPPPGWQPDPAWGDPPYGWQLWVADGAPAAATPGDSPSGGRPTSATWAVAISLVLAVVGLAIGMQPVSLLSGSGILYVGAAIAGGGAVLSFATHVKPWVQIVTTIAAFAVVANIVYVEHQLDVRRQQVNQEISSITGASSSNSAANPAPMAAAPTPVDYDSEYPPARDVALPPCKTDPATGWPQCLVVVRNHTPRDADYLVTLAIMSPDESVKYGEMTAYITGIAPGQYGQQVAQGFTAMPPKAKIVVGGVQRALS